MDLKRYDYSWRLTFFAERLLSRRADLIVANSYAGRDYFVTKGFAERRIEVVPNGIDLDRFANGNRFGRKFREEIGVADDEILIGIVARQDPMKGYDVFLRAAAQLAARRTKVRFVCVGSEGLLSSEALRVLSRSLGIADQVVWTGYRADVPAVLAGLDIATSASVFGEGFSNAVAEAMAAATPCVGTDVGDTARILGDTGLVVPPGDAGALAEAWLHLLDMAPEERRRLGTRARARVVENYAVARMVARMSDLYRALAARRAAVL
jgi:glycosyltransferase involved in cell wall biosynthesis